MSFDKLGLSKPILRVIEEKAYTSPTPIQEKAIPAVLSGKDVIATAQTGTGKTAGFALPILKLLSNGNRKLRNSPVRALILTPTRELASQVSDNFKIYGQYLPLRHAVVFGGVGINPQIKAIKSGVDILVATPGRLLDLFYNHAINLSDVEILVLDEADKMLDMGFMKEIRYILNLLPEERQNLLFSATFSDPIRKLASNILDNPVSINIAPEKTSAETVEQLVYHVAKDKKLAVLTKILEENNDSQVLIFTRTKYGANKLTKKLIQRKITAAAIHGDKSQNARMTALGKFKDGEIRILVATDIASRGLDIHQLPLVINYELPTVAADYVHRIGRTGRAGLDGHAISLVCSEEVEGLIDIEQILQKKLKKNTYKGFEPEENPLPDVEPKPLKKKKPKKPKKKDEFNLDQICKPKVRINKKPKKK